MSETHGIRIETGDGMDPRPIGEFDWLTNSSPMRGKDGTINSVLRRFGLRLVRDTKPDAAASGNKWGRYADEDHHRVYGRPWYIGRDYLDLLIARGLKPEHKLLDFGCGSMRAGIWIAGYLDMNGYHGIDSHRASLESAAEYEVVLHDLKAKNPRLLHSNNFQVDFFGVDFDFVFCASVFRHLSDGDRPLAAEAIRGSCRSGATFIVQSTDVSSISGTLEEIGFIEESVFEWGSRFAGSSKWTEFRLG